MTERAERLVPTRRLQLGDPAFPCPHCRWGCHQRLVRFSAQLRASANFTQPTSVRQIQDIISAPFCFYNSLHTPSGPEPALKHNSRVSGYVLRNCRHIARIVITSEYTKYQGPNFSTRGAVTSECWHRLSSAKLLCQPRLNHADRMLLLSHTNIIQAFMPTATPKTRLPANQTGNSKHGPSSLCPHAPAAGACAGGLPPAGLCGPWGQRRRRHPT